MLVSELIEYCQLCYLPESLAAEASNVSNEVAQQALLEAIVSHQPLQPFDPKLYQAALPQALTSHGIKQSYSQQWCPPDSNSQLQHGRFIEAHTQIVLEDDAIGDSVQDIEPLGEAEHVDISAFIRFFRNPAQYFFNRTLKVDLNLNIQADDNDEPFSLNALERYLLQAQLLGDALEQGQNEPSTELLQRLKASGNLPMQPFDDLLLRQYSHDIAPLIGRTLFMRGDVAPRHADIRLSFELPHQNSGTQLKAKRVILEGRIDDISPKGLVTCRPGSAHGRDILALYLRHLCLMAAGVAQPSYLQPSYLLDMGHFHALAPITPALAHAQLANLLKYFYQGQIHPLCFMPRTSLAYASAEAHEAQDSHTSTDPHKARLEAAQSEWLDEQGELGEGTDPHYQRLFHFPDDFTEAHFGKLADDIYRPMLSLYHKDTLAQLEEFALNEAQTATTEGAH